MRNFEEFINESYATDVNFDSAAAVYDIVDYKDINNKTAVKNALKKLGKATDSSTVDAVIKKMKEVTNESENLINEGSKINYVTITNDLFQADPNWWVKNKFKVSSDISKALAGCKTKHVVIDIDKVHESVSSIDEGRAFVAAAKKAKEEGKEEFEWEGKTYPVTIKESEDFLYEGDVNYRQDPFALVRIGGSIGDRATYPVFAGGGNMGSIIETGNDKEALQEKATRMRKSLSPGERKYYGLNYKVIELTPRKIKEIDMLINHRNSAENTDIE
jgi:hypothetical protein